MYYLVLGPGGFPPGPMPDQLRLLSRRRNYLLVK